MIRIIRDDGKNIIVTEYYKAITNSDISRVDNVKRDEERAKRIIRSYARHKGS